MKAAILGTTGYTGLLLLRLLGSHPEIRRILPVSSSRPGQPVGASDPALGAQALEKIPGGLFCTAAEAEAEKPEVVFAALPHLASAGACGPFFGASVVIDLSADFRLKDPGVFQAAYGQKPPRPDLLAGAVFGLAEVYRERIKTAGLIANPGCYPTASLLPLLPVLRALPIRGPVIINALSGISGAGKKVAENYLFGRRAENCGPYSPGRLHRHTVEIEQEASLVRPGTAILFTPHLVPLHRGMAVTTVLETEEPTTAGRVEEILTQAYGGEPFVRVRPGVLPESGDVKFSNRCDIGFHIEGRHLYLFSVIDNLMKGASGQAVQNMNIRFGFPETLGLEQSGAI
ncbi:MAG: N-acetyl-gamma-glutamyl-phosphate reductase [Spirochaetales bacterium]|jgi:N-acetyl-gamma-glutamyl-phosphate reductase|nr:N-acetyl-gamma-glutamyl-phosphate reductase [Spirochaetales bacterium]